MKNKKVIIFDFDGVIADSLHIAFAVSRLSKPTMNLERYQALFNGNINEEKAKYNDEIVREVDFFKEYGERFLSLGIDPDKKEYIQKLAEQFDLFIVSSTTGEIIREYLHRHGILDCFTEILGNEVDPSKEKKFQMIFSKYEIIPENVIFITDSVGDMREAREVGIQKIVAILGGYQNEESLVKGNPTVLVQDFPQFYDFVMYAN